MRSRYSAFVKRDLDYLWRTTDPETRAAFDREANRQWAEQASFTGLEIVSSSEDGDRGTVEFKASFTLGGRARVHHELSSFRREGGQWYFRDGREPGFGV
jgi:SEC-C motif-containing protein